MLKELIKVIQEEQQTYKDPITEFLECLYVNYDFNGAQQKLIECEQVNLMFFLPVFMLIKSLCLSNLCCHACWNIEKTWKALFQIMCDRGPHPPKTFMSQAHKISSDQ